MTDTETATLTTWLAAQLDAEEAEWGPAAKLVQPFSITYRDAAHHVVTVAKVDPARVLATVAAHRAIVEMHRPDSPHLAGQDFCTTCHDYVTHDGIEWPCPTLRAIASIYAGRDGWQEAWR